MAAGLMLLGATFHPYRLVEKPYILPTVIYSSDGQVLARLADEYRTPITIADVPLATTHAILAAEDTRFYEHHGLDWRGIARALWFDIRTRRLAQGGSTITQQLVRTELLNDQRTLRRKVSEVVLAIRVERGQTKDEILERYLNVVYFGGGSYGIATAAHSYFGKPVSHLTIAESALLAGLIRAPSDGNPRVNRTIAIRRQHAILAEMRQHGWLSSREYRQALDEKIVILPRKSFGWRAPYAVEMVRQRLVADYGRDMAYRGGLAVYTTIDFDLQRAAEQAMAQTLTSGQGRRVGTGALVAIDPKTGGIRAMVGGSSFWNSQFNRATQAHRQPGSSFKAFVYQAAIDHGHSLSDQMLDAPVTLGNWSPHNYGNGYHGMVTLERALALSLNSVSVRLVMEMSPFVVAQAARDAGITSVLQTNLTIALGSSEVTPLEMARAFATYANGGKSIAPSLIREIRRDGRVLYRHVPVARQTVKPITAYLLTQGLRQVILSGTGRRANIGRPAAGKTGTSNAYRDAWFIGYTPYLSTAVWMGNDNRAPMAGVAGGSLPAQAWAQFMRTAVRNDPPSDFPAPAGMMEVRLCAITGKLALPTCPSTKTRFLPVWGIPAACDLHTRVARRVCRETGLLVNTTCPAVDRMIFYTDVPTSVCPIHHEKPAPEATVPLPPPPHEPAEPETPSLRPALPPPGSSEQPHHADTDSSTPEPTIPEPPATPEVPEPETPALPDTSVEQPVDTSPPPEIISPSDEGTIPEDTAPPEAVPAPPPTEENTGGVMHRLWMLLRRLFS